MSGAKVPMETAARKAGAITVLVVDDEDSVRAGVSTLLQTFRMVAVTVRSTAEALHLASSTRIDVALIDWRLGGWDDGIALGRSLQRDQGIPFVLFSGYLDTESTGRAYKQGAADVLDKPIRPGRLLAAVRLALEHGPRTTSSTCKSCSTYLGCDSISQRWAKMALTACRAEMDPKTEPDVAHAAGVSTSVFRRDCQGCSVEPRAARDLVRLLRANSLAQQDGSTLRSHLATSDPRTCRRLFERAGLPIDSRFVPLSHFFPTQRLIPAGMECLRALTHLAANDHLFLVEPGDTADG